MASGADNERSSVLQSGAAEFLNRGGLAEIDRNITILHRRFKRVAQITLRGDLDLRFRTRELRDHLPHSAFRANEQHAQRFHACAPQRWNPRSAASPLILLLRTQRAWRGVAPD